MPRSRNSLQLSSLSSAQPSWLLSVLLFNYVALSKRQRTVLLLPPLLSRLLLLFPLLLPLPSLLLFAVTVAIVAAFESTQVARLPVPSSPASFVRSKGALPFRKAVVRRIDLRWFGGRGPLAPKVLPCFKEVGNNNDHQRATFQLLNAALCSLQSSLRWEHKTMPTLHSSGTLSSSRISCCSQQPAALACASPKVVRRGSGSLQNIASHVSSVSFNKAIMMMTATFFGIIITCLEIDTQGTPHVDIVFRVRAAVFPLLKSL